MKVLFATGLQEDYIAACAFNGLQEVCGEDSVIDAAGALYLHCDTAPHCSSSRIGGWRLGKRLAENPEHTHDFDLLVISTSFLRERDWHWPVFLRDAYLARDGKVILLEGWDGWNEIYLPPENLKVDAVFRREIAFAVGYHYDAPLYPFGFAAPERWFTGTKLKDLDRPLDLFWAGNQNSHPIRWDMLPWLTATKTRHRSLFATDSFSEGGGGIYLDCLKMAKIALCPPGGGQGSDCNRFAEAPAAGAIPLFVAIPDKVRENWYTKDFAFFAPHLTDLPGVIDDALASDLTAMRKRMFDFAHEFHTTRARARRMLEAVGMAP